MKQSLNSAPLRLCVGVFVVFLLLLPALSVSAFDWGLLIDQSAEMGDVAGNMDSVMDEFSYTAGIIPWFSMPFGPAGKPSGNFYLSAGFTVEYYDEDVIFIPELLRTELSYKFGAGKEISVGRMYYTDPLGFIANGLFDGAQFSMDLGGIGKLGIGAWYTGLLYKKNTRIAMTKEDSDLYLLKLDYSNFVDTYFAPRRILAAIDWEKPDLSEAFRLKAALIGQFDVSGNDELYHSQYLGAKFTYPVNNFVFELGACLEFAEHKLDDETKFKFSLAGELGVAWLLPTSIRDRLTFTARLSSGTVEDSSFAAFVPVTTEYQGDILRAKLSGLTMLRLAYAVKPVESLLITLADSYFVLSDKGTYSGYPEGKEGHFLGNEISAKLSWFPLSDLQLNLLGGVFLPSMGNADSDGKALWRIELSAKISVF